MLIAAIYHFAVGNAPGLDIHWAFAAFWLIPYQHGKQLNFATLHRVMLACSLPGLLWSVYWLLQPAEIAWAMKVGFSGYPRAEGFLSNPITFAEVMTVLFAWSLARLGAQLSPRERKLILVHLVLTALIFLFSRIRVGILGIASLGVVYLLLSPKHRKACLWMLLGLGLTMIPVFLFFGFNTASISERWLLIKQSLIHLAEFPFLGIGVEGFERFTWESGITGHPHNTLLGIATELGLPALVIYLWLMWELLVRIRKLPLNSDLFVGRALVSVFAVWWLFGIFDYNFGDTELLLLHALHWRLIVILTRSQRETPESDEMSTISP